jgi:hypothetical protein
MPFDFSAVSAPFRMQPGLRRIEAGALQLTPNTPQSRELTEKLAALSDHPEHALVASPGFDPNPALQALLRQAIDEHPADFSWDGHHSVSARRLGWSLSGDEVVGDGLAQIGECLRALPRHQRLAGLLSLAFAEDFAIIDGATACIPWLAVCLPSRWAPEDKVGLHFSEVHAPVADNQLIINASGHLARLVTGADRWERFVWTVSGEARLQQHPKHTAPTAWPAAWDASELAARAYFRTEHQTFIPVPGERQAVFTIHVESRPLVNAVAATSAARLLHDALESMSPAVVGYRGLTDARDRLLAWLDRQAADPSTHPA